MFSHSSMIWLLLWSNGSGWSFGLMAQPPHHWCLLDILACLAASWLAWMSYSNWIALSNSRVHLVVVKTKISSVASPRSWPRERPLGPARSFSFVLKGHDQMNSLVNGSVSAVGLEHSQPCCYWSRTRVVYQWYPFLTIGGRLCRNRERNAHYEIGTLILSKRNSSKRNTHIIKRNTHIIK